MAAERPRRLRWVTHNPWLRLAFGVVTTALGVMVVFWPGHTVTVISILFAVQLIVWAVFRFVAAFSGTSVHEWTRTANVVSGVMSLIAGLVFLRYPGSLGSEALSLVIVLGIYWIASGVLDLLITVAETRMPRRGVTAIIGILSILVGVTVLATPAAPITVIAWVLGGFLIVLGVITIVQAILLARGGETTASAA